MPTIGELHPKAKYYLGVDFARLGEDSSLFIVVEDAWDDEVYRVVYIKETKHQLLTDAIGRIKKLDEFFKFKKIFLDNTGLGSGPGDVLKADLGGKVNQINFTVASKTDMYSNLKVLLEKRKLLLPRNHKLIYQLMDLRYEYTYNKQLKLHHSDKGKDDYCDALALAVYDFRPQKQIVYTPTIV